jgi:AAA+ superfamily predicted ATPase
LDHALFRRFDDVIEYNVPSTGQIQDLLRVRLAQYMPANKAYRSIADAAIGLSHADITRAIDDAVKDAVMSEADTVTPAALLRQVEQRQSMRQRASADVSSR